MSAGGTAHCVKRWTSRTLSGVKHLVPFHHDPAHTDADLDRLFADAIASATPGYRITPALEGATFRI